ncbi:AAA family ATPase [Rhodoplanes sp. TEM]|nr:AAA family ATPase [Rhodoplanes tepidamans]MDC7984847.1 AAA family ATPase [Rhodoplanes sp. TEM]MDQ0358436.1 DNA transposition AAA+ family ATPase [Rhodoplanes tepidamans]
MMIETISKPDSAAPAAPAAPAAKAEVWGPPKGEPAPRDTITYNVWSVTREKVREIATRERWSKSEVARRSAVPLGTLSPWYDGTYTGQTDAITERVVKWLDSVEEMKTAAAAIPEAPGYVTTPTSQSVVDTLLYAQMMPEMVIVTLGAGMGKTTTARHFAESRPNVFLVTMRPTTAGTHAMLQELAIALDVTERNPGRLDRSIGQRLKRNGRHTLLIVDEAQNLSDLSINQLRYFLDEYGCGIALLGNDEVFSRFGRGEPKPGHGQIHRRIGKRVHRLSPQHADVEALLDAWSIEDREARRLLHGIARKPGALGQVDKTIRLATIMAATRGQPLAIDHVRAAWADRSGEEPRGAAA